MTVRTALRSLDNLVPRIRGFDSRLGATKPTEDRDRSTRESRESEREEIGRSGSYTEIMELKESGFAEKKLWFRHKCDMLKADSWSKENVRIIVSSGSLLEDSVDTVLSLSTEELQSTWDLGLRGAELSDPDRFAREWFTLVMKELFEPHKGLWQRGCKRGGDNKCLHIDHWSGAFHEDHLRYFRFIGRVMGKALMDGRTMKDHMMPYMYKCLVGMPATINDLKVVDKRYHNILQELDDIENFESLSLNFTVTEQIPFGGGNETTELVPGGTDVMVTSDNLAEYKQALLNYLLIGRVKHQLKSLLFGINDVVPMVYLSVFKSHELEVMMCGSLCDSHLEVL